MKVKEKSGSKDEIQQQEIMFIQSATGATPELISSLARNAFEKYIKRYNKFMNEDEPKAALKSSSEEHLEAKKELQKLTSDKGQRDQEDKIRNDKKAKDENVPDFTEEEKVQRAEFDRKYEQADGNVARSKIKNEQFLPASIEDILSLIIVESNKVVKESEESKESKKSDAQLTLTPESAKQSKKSDTQLTLTPENAQQSNVLLKAVAGNLRSQTEKNKHNDNDIINSLVALKYSAASDIMNSLSRNLLLTTAKNRTQSWNTVRTSVKESRDSKLLASKKSDVQAFTDIEYKYSNTSAMDTKNIRERGVSVEYLGARVNELREYVNQFYKFALAGGDNIEVEKTEAVLAHMKQQIAAFEAMPGVFQKKFEKIIDDYKGLAKELGGAINDYKQAKQSAESTNVSNSNNMEVSPERESPRNRQEEHKEAQPKKTETGPAAENSNNAERASERNSPAEEQTRGAQRGPNVGWVQARLKDKGEAEVEKKAEHATFTMGKK